MRISIYNDGDNRIRVIVDHDESDDLVPDPGEERIVDSLDVPGVIELRELDGPLADTSDDA